MKNYLIPLPLLFVPQLTNANELKCNIRMSGNLEKTTIFGNHKVLSEWNRDLCLGLNIAPVQSSKEPTITSCGFTHKGTFYKVDAQTFLKEDGSVNLNLYYRKGTSAVIIYDEPRPQDLQSVTTISSGQEAKIFKEIVEDNIFDKPSKRQVLLIKKISVGCDKFN